MKKVAIILYIFILAIAPLGAHQSYIGYSGAPGSNGTCARSCHQQTGFAPQCRVTGFPEIYTPGQQYTITISHAGQQPICQFNCSIRNDLDSSIAGTILPGSATTVYGIARESIGVHWAEANRDSGSFIWLAPDQGVGNVTLYWAGLQGTYIQGADQQIAISAAQALADIEYTSKLPSRFELQQNYPNPFNASTVVRFSITRQGDIVLEIANILGQTLVLFRLTQAHPGTYSITWDGKDKAGKTMPSGLYFYQLRTPEANLTRKMTILR
jgi:hypothetical protein